MPYECILRFAQEVAENEYASKFLTKEDYDARVNFILRVKEGVIDCRDHYLTGNLNPYKWLLTHYSKHENILLVKLTNLK